MYIINNTAIMFILAMSNLFSNYTYCKDYCKPELCNNSKTHILCKFKLPGPSNNCGNYERLITTDKEKQDILDKLNSRRNKIASGEIRSLPSAENMMKLIWNEELEFFAQRWADQCVKSSPYHETDSCRDLESTSVGQNIATIYGESPGLTASSLVDLWYMELLNINASILQHYLPSFESEIQRYDYFTQLAWADSTEVGCGGVKYKELNIDSSLEGSRTVYRLVCNFAPSGNRVGLSVYNNGIPCSRCLLGSSCDTEYHFLCATKATIKSIIGIKDDSERSYSFIDSISETTTETKNESLLEKNTQQNPKESEFIADNDTQFDFMSHLFDITKKSFIETESTTKCKEVLAIDEFLELLKSRLSNDQILKELLLSTTKLPITESIAFDKTVAALIDRLYTKKKTAMTTTSTESNVINSTFLADLVEAVIFRHSDKYSSTEYNKIHTDIEVVVAPVKVQAEFAEIKPNMEFTGHYFFPEDEEQSEQETTILYDDAETIPGSEIVLEIEDIKRSRVTKDFIDAILESDFDAESITDHVLPTYNNNNGKIKVNKTINSSKLKKRSIVLKKIHLMKRNSRCRKDLFINYSDLLKHLAEDLRMLKLNERFHCTYNFVQNSRPTSICLLFLLKLVILQ